MLRIRSAMTLLAALVLAGAACGDGDTVAAVSQQPEAEATVTTQAGPDDASEDRSDAAAAEDGVEAVVPDAQDGAAPADEGPDAPPVDAGALLAAAVTQLDGRSVRGEAALELAPGFALTAAFDSDAEGDLAAVTELPPGMAPEFPGGAEFETRYVGGTVYARPPVRAEVLAGLGLEEAWYVDDPAMTADPAAQAMGAAGGAMCIFSQADGGAFEDCDPLGEAGDFLEYSRDPEIVGREDVRGVETTRVRFLASLLDLIGEGLGMVPGGGDAGASEGGAFDDTASDPFAEGLEQILGFLDAGIQVEVWIDDDNLIRRLTFDLASLVAGIADGDGGAEMPSSLITLEFYDYDADISVVAPPPASIVDPSLILDVDDYAASGEHDDEGCEEFYDEEYDETYAVCD